MLRISISCYRELITGYAKIALSITNLLRKDVKFKWTETCQQTFNELRGKLSTYLVLRPPRWDLPFHVFYDASAVAVGNALCQPTGVEENNQPVTYAIRQLTIAKRNYTTTERECLAMVF